MVEKNLFGHEEKVLNKAEEVLQRGAMGDLVPSQAFQLLLTEYRKLYKQTQRLIKMSDRIHRDMNLLNEKLRQSEVKYRNIFENVTEGIFRSLPDGTLLEGNPALANILGYDSGKMMTDVLKQVKLFKSQKEAGPFLKLLQGCGQVKNYQLEISRWDGECIWIEISAHAILDEKGEIAGIEGIISDVTERKRIHDELEDRANTDSLTGLYNRRCFVEKLKYEIHRSKRCNYPVSLLMMDLDHFKSVNDNYGHDTGDRVLRHFSDICLKTLRENDVLGRLGGEEFAAILPNTDLAKAVKAADKLRKRVEASPLSNGCRMIAVTVSVGLVQINQSVREYEKYLKCADQALYEAKRGGRNSVRVFDMGPAGK